MLMSMSLKAIFHTYRKALFKYNKFIVVTLRISSSKFRLPGDHSYMIMKEKKILEIRNFTKLRVFCPVAYFEI